MSERHEIECVWCLRPFPGEAEWERHEGLDCPGDDCWCHAWCWRKAGSYCHWWTDKPDEVDAFIGRLRDRIDTLSTAVGGDA